ncbi:MAG TPA: hypothetical protein VI958_11830 [Acidobacteriota bacterium]
MIFTLEVLDARFGDALLLHYGSSGGRKLIVIDGGPSGVYKATLRPRLKELQSELDPAASLPIRLLMVSHIDGDHITGVISLADEMVKQKQAKKPAPYRVDTLWHNSFDDIIGNEADVLYRALSPIAGRAIKLAGSLQPSRISPMGARIIMTVRQGRDLRGYAKKLRLKVNKPFPKWVIASDDKKNQIQIDDDLKFTVIGPDRDNLINLRKEWDKELKKMKRKKDLRALMDFLDVAAENLSSIVVLAECGGKTMLLTGDARGDFIISGLRQAGLLKYGKFHTNLLKIPHHGSDRNVSTDFFRQITADHYVISADGTYGNPDIPTLQMLSNARGKSKFNIYLTNKEKRLVTFFRSEKQKGKKYKVFFREEDAYSISVPLGDSNG